VKWAGVPQVLTSAAIGTIPAASGLEKRRRDPVGRMNTLASSSGIVATFAQNFGHVPAA
jgi:hypothetical protein